MSLLNSVKSLSMTAAATHLLPWSQRCDPWQDPSWNLNKWSNSVLWPFCFPHKINFLINHTLPSRPRPDLTVPELVSWSLTPALKSQAWGNRCLKTLRTFVLISILLHFGFQWMRNWFYQRAQELRQDVQEHDHKSYISHTTTNALAAHSAGLSFTTCRLVLTDRVLKDSLQPLSQQLTRFCLVFSH